MAITLHSQAMVTVDQALAYLQDQGSPNDSNDLLRMHINGITAMMMQVTGRRHLKWVDGDAITEYRNGDGCKRVFLKEAPIVEVTSLQLLPQETTAVDVTVPTGGATFSDEMFFDAARGSITLKSRLFPMGDASAKIVYEAGYLEADPEYMGLQMITLDALATKWARWKTQKHGVTSESRGEQSVTYSLEDFSKSAMADLRRYRRNLFA